MQKRAIYTKGKWEIVVEKKDFLYIFHNKATIYSFFFLDKVQGEKDKKNKMKKRKFAVLLLVKYNEPGKFPCISSFHVTETIGFNIKMTK